MSSIMVILDGATDLPVASLGRKTPFVYADCTHLEQMSTNGLNGFFETCPPGIKADSLPCTCSLMGLPNDKMPAGRAYFEARAADIFTTNEDLILRCNLVVFKGSRLISSTGATLHKNEMECCYAALGALTSEQISLHHIGGYKGILILKKDDQEKANVQTTPPHTLLNNPIVRLRVHGEKYARTLNAFLDRANACLAEVFATTQLGGQAGTDDEKMRLELGVWGESEQVTGLPSFCELHGFEGAMVCGTQIARGIGLCLGMYTPLIPGATGDVDTDLSHKVQAALTLAKDYQLVVVHINGADEASHRRDPLQKALFLKRIDNELLAPLMESGHRLLVTSDHATISETGVHQDTLQPFALYPEPYKQLYSPLPGQSAIGLVMGHKG